LHNNFNHSLKLCYFIFWSILENISYHLKDFSQEIILNRFNLWQNSQVDYKLILKSAIEIYQVTDQGFQSSNLIFHRAKYVNQSPQDDLFKLYNRVHEEV
jgi:hypothetical protein